MPAPLIRYVLDPTGSNPDNLVAGEVKTLSNAPRARAAAPTYGPFFAESIVIYDHLTNQLLQRGVHYELLDLVEEPSLQYGKEIMQLIVVTNNTVSPQIRLNYQVLGGLYQNNSEGLIEMYEAAVNDSRPVDWNLVFDKPNQYPPQPHLHLGRDITGMGPVVVALEDIANAITLSNIPAFESLIEWVKANAGASVLFSPVVQSLQEGNTQTFQIQTTKMVNGRVLYWTIEHNGTVDANFEEVSGSFSLFQNRGQFTIALSHTPPAKNQLFNIQIRADSVDGDVLEVIEGIIYVGVDPNGVGLGDLLTTCCLYELKDPFNVTSLYIIGMG